MNQKSSQSQSQAQNKGDANVDSVESQSLRQPSQSVKAPAADSNSPTATTAKESSAKPEKSEKPEKKAKSFDELLISKGVSIAPWHKPLVAGLTISTWTP